MSASSHPSADVLPDTTLAEHGLPARAKWTPPQWLAFLDGWAVERLGVAPSPIDYDRAFHRFGRFEARHFGAAS